MSRFLRALVVSAAATAAAYAATVAFRARRSARATRRPQRADAAGLRAIEDDLTDEETRALVAELSQQV
jgi:hypothetical protein